MTKARLLFQGYKVGKEGEECQEFVRNAVPCQEFFQSAERDKAEEREIGVQEKHIGKEKKSLIVL